MNAYNNQEFRLQICLLEIISNEEITFHKNIYIQMHSSTFNVHSLKGNVKKVNVVEGKR